MTDIHAGAPAEARDKFAEREEITRLDGRIDTHRAETAGRFGTLEEKLDRIIADMAGLKTDMAELKTDMAGVKTEISALKGDIKWLKWLVGVIVVLVVAPLLQGVIQIH